MEMIRRRKEPLKRKKMNKDRKKPSGGISISSRKQKGRRLQQWVTQKIGELINLPWGKDKDIESRPMGQDGPDIRLSQRARHHFPFSVECKNIEQLKTLWDIVDQARINQEERTDWLVFLKRNKQKTIVVLDGDVFFKILSEWGEMT